MNGTGLWKKFEETGKVEDYLEYTKFKGVAVNNSYSAVQSEDRKNDSNYTGNSFEGTKNQ